MQPPLKAGGWWNYKIPPLLAIAYYALASAPQPLRFSEIQIELALYIVAVTGIAGFGHVFLDAFDVEEDRLLGKSNLWAGRSAAGRALLLAVLLAASWLPWIVLPAPPIVVGLLVLEFVMFALYAVPPIRLKERGLPGIVADAMYAHALPALWTWIPFALMARAVTAPWFPLLLGGWSLVVGTRHLLQHQAIQIESDRKAGAKTAAVRRGREATLRLIAGPLLSLEAMAFLGLVVTIGGNMPAVGIGFLVYLIWQLSKLRFLWLARFNIFGAMADEDRVTVVGTLILTRFYERWLPLIVLVVLTFREPSYLPLLLIHLLVFRGGLVELLRDDVPLAATRFA